MISVEWKKSNLDSFYKKMENIICNLEPTAEDAMKEIMKEIQTLALQFKVGKKDITMIPFAVEVEGNFIKGRLYTDKKTFGFASFMEFGTGTYAELPHIGITKTFIESGYTFWYLPVEKVDRDFGSNRIVVINGKQFYIMYPQQPRPFMRPAGFQGRDIATDILQEKLFKMLKEVVR